MKYHKVVYQILDLLKEGGYWHETFEHAEVLTSHEAAGVRDGYTLHQGAKAMIVKLKIPEKAEKFVMLVLPGDKRFDGKKVKDIFGARDIRFATEEEIAKLTDNVQIGGVPPFGNLFGLEVVVDPSLLANEKIIFNAGDRRFSIGMKSADYQKLVKSSTKNII